MNDNKLNIQKKQFPTLKPKKYDLDFFLVDDIKIDNFKDEITSMEHPFFALKPGDFKAKLYRNNDTEIVVSPSLKGLATIFDKDIWIYVISKNTTSVQ